MADRKLKSITFPGIADPYVLDSGNIEYDSTAEYEAGTIGNAVRTMGGKFCDELEVDEDGLVYLVNNGERIAGPYGPFAGGGGGGGGNNAILTVTNTTGWITKTLAEGGSCSISFNWSSLEDDIPTGNGSVRVMVNAITKTTMDIQQGDVILDITDFLATGGNTVRIQVSDIYGNMKSINYTVTVVALSISSLFDANTAFSDDVNFTYTPVGAVAKTVYFILDGQELGTYETSISGRQLSYTIPAQTHGAHSFQVYYTAEINGETVSSNVLNYDLIFIEEGVSIPIIASTFDVVTAEQYTTLSIPYTVYTPSSLSSSVQFYVNDELVSEQTVDRTPQIWTYRADNKGSLELSIMSGTAEKIFNLTISESYIDAEVTTDDMVLSLQAAGRSNNEPDPAVWTYDDISCAFTDFNFKSDGWLLDDDNCTFLRVRGDARLTIPYKPFETDFKRTGKTIEIEFSTRDVLDYDATILSCLDNGRGLYITPQKATMVSEQAMVNMQYKEEEHIRLSIVTEKSNENRLLMAYINGIPTRVVQYPSGDNFAQVTPANISIGSSYCTIDIYSIRIYDNNLTRNQILDNWIMDTQDVNAMVARYNENNVYDEYGNIVIAKLPTYLPYMILSAPELPQYKGDKKTIYGSYTDPANSANNFTFEGCQINVQGTSSAPYARKNYDLQFKNGFNMRAGHADNFALAPDVVPFNRFVLKADVASSEGANNVELVKLFCDINPFRSREEQLDPKVRQGIYGFPIVVFWNNTTTGETSFLGKYNFNLPKRAPEPYGYSGDMESWEFQNNTSNNMLFKDADFTSIYVDVITGDVYPAWKNDWEARFPDDTWEDIDKLKEFAEFVVSTRRDTATGDAISPVTYDGVTYTTDTAEYRLAKFKNQFPTYADLNSFVFYYIFTELFLMVDSRAKNLFIGFNGPDVTVTGRMADRKAVAQPYDMDTGLGTNNEGSLVFGYSLEDTDHLAGGANIFNGQDSVLWCNLRDAFKSQIATMYKTLRSQGTLSYASVEQRYEDHQSKWPEAVWIEDTWFKYIDPLINPDPGKEPTAVYLPMMQGSKEEQRKWWLSNRFQYMDSKWVAGDAIAYKITLRGYEKADIVVTPYIDLYPTVDYASTYLVQARGQHGQPTTLACPMDALNDTEIYIHSAPYLASVGDLSGLKVGFADFSAAVRLQHIKVGDSSQSYENRNLTHLVVGSNKMLKTIDARNCISLGTSQASQDQVIELANCPIIEEVYFDGTSIKGVTLPDGGMLRVLHLPGTITTLNIKNQNSITDLTIGGYSNLSTLIIENSNVDARTILNSINAGSRVRLTGFYWEAEDAEEIEDILDLLDTMIGVDEGGYDVPKAVLSGTIHTDSLTGAQIASYNARYPYLTVTADSVTSVLYYKTWDGSSTVKAVTYINGVAQDTAPSVPSRTATAQYNFTAVGWNLEQDASVDDPDCTKDITGDRTVYAAYSRVVRTYTATFMRASEDGGGTLYTQQNIPYGTVPTYGGSTPTTTRGDA